jgi:hypothetical protein
MADEQATTVKLSQEDVQRFAKMEERLNALESENGILKGALGELKSENDTLNNDVKKFQDDAKAASIQAYCLKLERDYNLTPAAIEIIKPNLSAENGVVKLSEDSEPVQAEQAYMQSIEGLLTLAREKDALFVPQQTTVPKGKQDTGAPMSLADKKRAAIAKFSKDADGNDVPYARALLLASRDPESAQLFNPLAQQALTKEG